MVEVLIPLRIEPLEEGGYLATSPIVEDLLAWGRSTAETVETAQDVARKLIESYVEHDDPLSPAVTQALSKSEPRRYVYEAQYDFDSAH